MTKFSLLILPLLLASCRREPNQVPSGIPGASDTMYTQPLPPPIAVGPAYVFMGQSNSLGMYQNALSTFKAAFPKARFINCAVGGTAIIAWQAGQPLYDNCKVKINGEKVLGIIFWQGENEAEGGPDRQGHWAQEWPDQFMHYAQSAIADYHAPIFMARLGDLNEGSPWWGLMRTNQTDIHLAGVSMVNLDGIPANMIDGRHYTVDGYKEAATRFIRRMTGAY